QHIVIRLFHLFFGPGLKDRIVQIRNSEAELTLGLGKRLVCMLLVGDYWTRAGFRRKKVVPRSTVRHPQRSGICSKCWDRACSASRVHTGWRMRQNPCAKDQSGAMVRILALLWH